MPRGSRCRRRLVHHALVALGAVAAGCLLNAGLGKMDLRNRVSFLTAYLGLGGIALSLILGPLNLVLGRPNPISSDLRRDIGIWAALVSLAHVVVGLTVHLRGKMAQYFIPAPEAHAALPIRFDPFGLANYLGVASAAVLLLLLLLSNDVSLRRLGAPRWKRWQQWNYLAAGAMALHGVLYQLIEKQRIRFVVLFGLVLVIVGVTQWLGVRAQRPHGEVPIGARNGFSA